MIVNFAAGRQDMAPDIAYIIYNIGTYHDMTMRAALD